MAAKTGKANIGYIVIGVLVAVVLIVWLLMTLKAPGSSDGDSGLNYTATVQGATVVAGKPAANKVDVYEDFLCPICGRFEGQFGDDLAKAINAGKVQVVYHPVAILNRATTPNGYSQRAASAALCAAQEGFFPAYHKKLFDEQPAEMSAGLTDQELITKGQQVGAPAGFAKCVTDAKFSKTVGTETKRAVQDPSIRAKGEEGFGTPTVTVNGKYQDLSDGSWVDNLNK
ncbi:DsbA family protein [Pseudonocardia spinosispora]|uniref:DsbA family protein n=1 Tax=Pseudonocardia spinosispora TaxID=103441 RepID=UPI000416662F|nr:thioredoxin domain-containing protein [Pseudonocardia spinosispora]